MKLYWAILLSFLTPISGLASTQLNQAAISENYKNGDFDAVEKEIRVFQTSGKAGSQADSLFMAKHLAVVYGANPATREKSKYYMHVMLNIDAGANFTDMFLGEKIQTIFSAVRDEFVTARKVSGRPLNKKELAEFEGSNQDKIGNSEAKNGAGVWWTIGGVAAAAVVGATTYVLVSGEDEEPVRGPGVVVPDLGAAD